MVIKNLYYLIFRGLDKITILKHGGYASTRENLLIVLLGIFFNAPILGFISKKVAKDVSFNAEIYFIILMLAYCLNWYLFIKKKQKYLDYLKEYSSYSRSKKLLYGVMAFILALFLSIVPYFYF